MGKISKQTVIKGKTVGSVPFQTKRGGFHDNTLTALINHTAHRFLYFVGFGGSVGGFGNGITDDNAEGTDHAGFQTALF